MENINIHNININKRSLLIDIYFELEEVFLLHRYFIFIIALYTIILLFVSLLLNVVDNISLSLYGDTLILMTLILFFTVFFVGYSVYVMIFVRPEQLFKYIIEDLRTNCFIRKRLFNALPIFLFLPLFMSCFTAFKSFIPIINPFSWDNTFAKIDGFIHNGYQPWQLLLPIFQYPILTTVINFFYNLWFFVMFFVMYWQAFTLNDVKSRMQFFLSFTLVWSLLGTGIAIVFSSAGPCYYGKVVHSENIYYGLIENLNIVREYFPVWALNTQKTLWSAYLNNNVELGSGISAMPSMHVSTAILFSLIGHRRNRLLGIAFSFFALVIFVGSIHLGWHYAIDGYVSFICTVVIWHATGIFLDHFLFNKVKKEKINSHIISKRSFA